MGSRASTCDSGCDRYVRLHHPRSSFGERRRGVNVRNGSRAEIHLRVVSGHLPALVVAYLLR